MLGNHEFMNLQHQYGYVNDIEWEMYGERSDREREWSATGELGSKIRELDVVKAIRNSAVVHGGLDPDLLHGYKTLQDINNAMRHNVKDEEFLKNQKAIDADYLTGNFGPLWHREFAEGKNETAICEAVLQVLKAYGLERMIVGHTPTHDGKIGMKCDMALEEGGPVEPRLYAVDVGISRWMDKRIKSGLGMLELVTVNDKVVEANAVYDKNGELDRQNLWKKE